MKLVGRASSAVAILALAFTAPISAQVVFDAASNTATATASTANPINVTWNHTVGSAKKPYLVVGVSLDLSGGGATVGSVTYGTEAGGPQQAMTFLGAATNGTNARAELWGLANPTPGTHTIQVSVANAGGQNVVVVGGAKSFTNVLETAATGNAFASTGNSLTPAVAVTNSGFDYVVDAVAFNNNVTLTPAAGQTNSYDVIHSAPNSSGAGSAKTGVANTTMAWTATGTAQPWAEVAVPVLPATPQILFDAVSSATGVVSNANPIVVTWNHTTTTAANRYLVVQVGIRLGGGTYGTNVTTTSVTYGAQAMTLLGGATRGTSERAELWGLVAPASGTGTITVTVSNTGARNLAVTCGAQSFSGVDQSAPTGALAAANNGNTTPTVAVTNSASDYVVDAVAFNTNIALTAGAQQDGRWNTITTGQNFSGGSSGAHGYANVTMSWTQTGGSQNWAIAAIPLKQVSVAITKTASADVIKLADTVTYTLRVTNYGAATVNNVTVTDAIPAGANFVSQSGCAGTGPVSCNIGTLAAGTTSAPITITVLPTAAGTISNVATVTWTGATASNSSETVTTLAEQKVCASPGKDGAGGTLAGIKNDYWPGGASVGAGGATMTLGARATGGAGNGITAGDLLIVMQMQDAAFDTTNDETYGEGSGSTKATGTGSGAMTSLNNAGRWEYVVAANTVGAAGGTLNFTGGGVNGGLLYSYTNQTFATTTTQGQRTFQVIRVPQYTTATLGSTLTALPWNGAAGGVLAVDVSGTITLGGATVSVNGLGFRGGGGRVLGPGGTGASTDFRTLSTDATNGSKGEGVAGTQRFIYQSGATIGAPGVNTPLDTTVEGYVNGSYGRGAPGNAGGGSTDGDPPNNDMNSGGGGGGNGGNGGSGGNGWSCNCPSGGQGGGGISPSLTRITLGGGGGAGTSNNGSAETCVAPPTCRVNVATDWVDTDPSNGYYSSGANGGGIIIIRAMQATGSATLTANGFTAYNTGRDGSGGGGAGGSVLFSTQLGDLSGLTIQAKGGNGGNAWLTTAPGAAPSQRHGPGGGGGGGYILLSSAAASTDVSGGANGLTTTSNDPYGAQPGTAGIVQLITGNNVLPGGDGASCIINDLTVTNSAPARVTAGSNVTSPQSVSNAGAFAADSVVYMAPIPASATFQSITVPPGWTCITPAVGGTGVITCTTPTLAAGATANFSLVVNAVAGTPAGYVMTETNSVSSNTPDSNPANNQATASTVVETGAVDMAVTIAQSTSLPTPGSNITYSETVSNLGGTAASSPSYTFAIPANTTFQSMGAPPAGWTCIIPAVNGTGTITCSATSLAAGTTLTWPSIVVKVNAGAPAGTTITASPSVSSSSTDSYSPNNTASVTATVVAAGTADVAVTISSSPNPLAPGQSYNYSVVATNNGISAAANVAVSIPLPAGTNFRSIGVPAGWTCTTPGVGSGGTINCSIASLAVGASATFTPQVQVNTATASGTTLNLTTTITTTTSQTITSNDSASASNLVTARTNADVSVVKTGSPNPVGQGQLVTYRIAVTNNGPVIATNVTITDPLPASVSLVSATPSIGSCGGTTTISCSLGSLPVGNTQYVDIIVQANNTGTLTNTATISRTETDPVPSNDSSTASLTVLAVTLVRLRDLRAVQDKNNVLLTWQTSYESDNLGFNLYRDAGGVRTKLNKGLIAGSALVAKKQDKNAGHAYRFRDTFDGFAQYWLEDVDIHGVHTMHGPVSPTPGNANAAANTTPLAGLGASGTVLASPAGIGVVHTLTLGDITDAQMRQQRDLAGDAGLKIFVTEEGWQRVTKPTMLAAGFDPGTDSSKLALFCAGIEQPIRVDDGGDGKFDSADAIEFYGLPLDTRSTGARTYWLRSKGGNNRVALNKDKGGDPITGSVSFTARRIDRNIFFAALTNVEENFFGPLIMSGWDTAEDLTVGALDPAYGGNATLDVTIQGGTDQIVHIVGVNFAGHDLGTVSLPSMTQQTFSFPLPQSWLAAGANTLSLTALNGDDDVSLLAEARLTYQHLLRADSGALEVALPGGRAVTVGGFADAQVRAVDITDSQHPIELQTAVAADAQGGFAATFTTPSGSAPRTILAFDSTRRVVPQEVVANRPSTWSAPNTKGADLVVISNPAFLDAAAAIVPARGAQGISTAIVDVDDVYDEFNFGVRDPQAIRAFMQNAAQWKIAPRWLMLVGDASIDPRDYLGMGSVDYLPTKLVATTQLETASDDWFTDFNGDGIADVPVGRISVRSAGDAARVFNRLAARGAPAGPWSNSALFVADDPGDFDFAAAAASVAALLPPSFSTQTIGPDHGGIVSAMNGGPLLVDYIGHGSVEIWSNPDVFNSADAFGLSNGDHLPFVVAMTCLNGYFHDVYTDSLAEALLNAPGGGAIAVWASSTLTQPDQQAIMNRELFRQLFAPQPPTLGEAVARAKAAANDPDVRKSWVLFGDPSMRLK